MEWLSICSPVRGWSLLVSFRRILSGFGSKESFKVAGHLSPFSALHLLYSFFLFPLPLPFKFFLYSLKQLLLPPLALTWEWRAGGERQESSKIVKYERGGHQNKSPELLSPSQPSSLLPVHTWCSLPTKFQ